MKIFRKILEWFANPKWYFLLPVIIIAAGSTVGATIIMTQDMSEYLILGYALLGIMIVTLSYSVFGVIRIYPKAKAYILKRAEDYPRINTLFRKYGFATLISAAVSLIISLAFAVYNGSIAIVIRSIWFGALAAYYIVLIALRGSIVAFHGKNIKASLKGQSDTQTLIKDVKLYRTCGILLLLLPLCMSFAILQMVRAGDSFEHKGITIYVYAIYAFYKIISAIYSFIKERHSNSMTTRAVNNVTLADAMVSVLALQTAMFREFGGPGDFSAAAMNAVTGAIVCALTFLIGVFMIINATLRIKKLKQEQVITNNAQSEDNGTKNDL